MEDISGKLLKIDEVSKILGMHPKTIRRYVRNNELKAVKIGKEYRIKVEDLKQFIDKEEVINHMEVDGLDKVDAFLKGKYGDKNEIIQVCSIVTIKTDLNRANEISQKVMDYVNNENDAKLEFKYVYRNDTARFILFGNPTKISELLNIISK